MQLASRPAAVGDGAKSGLVAGKVLAASVALVGAGVIAANPVTPALPSVQQHGVELTATTEENLSSLMDLISANPSPIGTALGELAGYYGQTTQDSITASMQGVEGIWSGMGAAKGLETILPEITEYIQNGDFTNAYNLLNWDMLFDMQNVFQPLFDHTVRGTGEFVPGVLGIGADMTRVWANVQDLFGDFNFWKSAAKFLTEPFIGFQFALSDNLTDHGDHVAQDPIDALLNGYVPWAAPDGSDADPHGAFVGLLTENGTFAYLLEGLPSKIADALTQNLPVDEPVDAVDADAAAAAFTAAGSVFDADWLTGFFS